MRASLHRLTGAKGAEWLLCGLFLAGVGLVLSTLEYNFDEGVYIQQALQIIGGNLPYRDFFCHQTPLYPLTLAAFAAPVPDSLFVFRLMSLLATALMAPLEAPILDQQVRIEGLDVDRVFAGWVDLARRIVGDRY